MAYSAVEEQRKPIEYFAGASKKKVRLADHFLSWEVDLVAPSPPKRRKRKPRRANKSKVVDLVEEKGDILENDSEVVTRIRLESYETVWTAAKEALDRVTENAFRPVVDKVVELARQPKGKGYYALLRRYLFALHFLLDCARRRDGLERQIKVASPLFRAEFVFLPNFVCLFLGVLVRWM